MMPLSWTRRLTVAEDPEIPVVARRGPKGEIWKIEESVYPLIQLCSQILTDNPLFFLINSYTTGLQPAVLSYMISTVLGTANGTVTASEIGLPVSSNGLVLPCGASGRYEATGI